MSRKEKKDNRFNEKEASGRGKDIYKKIQNEEKRVRHFHDITKK